MLETNNNIDLKQVNKNLKEELLALGLELSEQSCLDLLLKALGYEDCKTYLQLKEVEEAELEQRKGCETQHAKIKKDDDNILTVLYKEKEGYSLITEPSEVLSRIAHLLPLLKKVEGEDFTFSIKEEDYLNINSHMMSVSWWSKFIDSEIDELYREILNLSKVYILIDSRMDFYPINHVELTKNKEIKVKIHKWLTSDQKGEELSIMRLLRFLDIDLNIKDF